MSESNWWRYLACIAVPGETTGGSCLDLLQVGCDEPVRPRIPNCRRPVPALTRRAGASTWLAGALPKLQGMS
jgi:hypothetical protein